MTDMNTTPVALSLSAHMMTLPLTISSLLVCLFFGGWHGTWLPPVVWFALKTGFFMMLFILLRASLPRPRYDQVMSFGWKVCLPLTLLNLLVTGAMVLLAQ